MWTVDDTPKAVTGDGIENARNVLDDARDAGYCSEGFIYAVDDYILVDIYEGMSLITASTLLNDHIELLVVVAKQLLPRELLLRVLHDLIDEVAS